MTEHDARHGIVVGVDGSSASDAAIRWAAHDAALRRVPITIVYAQGAAFSGVWLDVPLSEDYWRLQEQYGKQVLQAARRVVQETTGPLTISEKLASGHAVGALIDCSRTAELVVVGSRGLGKWSRRLLGSVSSSLVLHAHGPVAVVHQTEGGISPTAPVVVGLDGSPASELATEIAFDEASRRRVELVVVHTWNDLDDEFPDVEWADLKPREDRILSEQLAGWAERYPDVAVRRVLMRDRPARQLLAQAESAQLVVVGSRGRGGFTGMLLGSVSSEVVHSARIPVIVARRST
ncbi:universal stress protein [Mycolicibacterium sp. XJ870]